MNTINEDVKFELFVPPTIPKHPLNLNELYLTTGRNYQYASRGRHAIYHILKALDVHGSVIIPNYICPTVPMTINNMGLTCEYCDINRSDLNINFDSFIDVQRKTKSKCVIVPSLYGNPAQIDKIEAFCRDQGIKLIDDAAQSFGAQLNDRYLSTFGDAGFFAFSPGKATPGPMGALFWCKGDYNYKKTHHPLIHKAIELNYRVNRKNVYGQSMPQLLKSLIRKSAMVLEKFFCMRDDGMCPFEASIIGGMVEACLNGDFSYRNEFVEKFEQEFCRYEWLDIVLCQHGIANNHKIVVILPTSDMATAFRSHLLNRGIRTYGGYKANSKTDLFPVASQVTGKIVELPIENDPGKMDYLFSAVESFCENAHSHRVAKL